MFIFPAKKHQHSLHTHSFDMHLHISPRYEELTHRPPHFTKKSFLGSSPKSTGFRGTRCPGEAGFPPLSDVKLLRPVAGRSLLFFRK
uniref:Uncharacterized protein n=1 Tax=Anguilla anguilla TaxID=7936 RepID=A0A0E9WT71_ANGAN